MFNVLRQLARCGMQFYVTCTSHQNGAPEPKWNRRITRRTRIFPPACENLSGNKTTAHPLTSLLLSETLTSSISLNTTHYQNSMTRKEAMQSSPSWPCSGLHKDPSPQVRSLRPANKHQTRCSSFGNGSNWFPDHSCCARSSFPDPPPK